MVQEVVKLGDNQESGLAKYAVKSPANHAVNVEHSQGVGVIGAGITGNIKRAWVEYGGEEVTEVPEGENFVVKVSFTADNPGAYVWSTAITVISTDGEIKECNPTVEFAAHQDAVYQVPWPGSLGPMPAHDISLRVKLWGNQDRWDMPGVPDCPPENQW